MTKYVGIDLGTTNSAICSYDGENIQLYKSSEQHSVTPSAIYIDKRSRYYGARAYRMAARSPNNTAILFKRLMGSSTKILIPAVNIEMTPEECSAEILRTLFSYLPEDIRNDPNTGTVITVPAAFNQMQKTATLDAANLAQIGKVALLQEPVAAVMSVMRQNKSDGMFLIYDMGGGTFDIALAESISGRVNLLANSGIEMCGGRDFDRAIFDNIVNPWLFENFVLPDNFSVNKKYQILRHLGIWATEQAKIELSFNKEETNIYIADTDINLQDEVGDDIYIDVEITRERLNELIEDKIDESIKATRELLAKNNLSPHDITRIVFIGGPTQYTPLRERVSSELGISGSTAVDPMTAVAEGAAVFAESIDWSKENRGRKTNRGILATMDELGVEFIYQSRTPDVYGKVVIKLAKSAHGATWQLDSLDSGWSSGRMELVNAKMVDVPLNKNGENYFKVFVFDPNGGSIDIKENIIKIVRTAATIDAIPASHSIGVAVKDKLGGMAVLDFLVTAGEHLPKKGQTTWRAENSLCAGGNGQIVITLWEGDIKSPITDNRRIGVFKITGDDFDEGIIQPNDELVCDYEINDAGTIALTVTVESVRGTFASGHNFYSRQEGQIDYANSALLIDDELDGVLYNIEKIAETVNDKRLTELLRLINDSKQRMAETPDPENCKQAMDNALTAKRILNDIRLKNLQQIRSARLIDIKEFFDEKIRQYANQTEINTFTNLAETAYRYIGSNSSEFEMAIDGMRTINGRVLGRQDWYIIGEFKRMQQQEYLFTDKNMYRRLMKQGNSAIVSDDISGLRDTVIECYQYMIDIDSSGEETVVNIVKG